MRAFLWWVASFALSLPSMIGNVLAAPWRALLKAAPVKLWAMIGAGVALTVLVAWQVRALRIELGGAKSEPERLLIFGGLFNVIYAELFLIALVIIALTGTIVKISAGKEGLRADVAHDDDAPGATTTTTSTSSGVSLAPAADVVKTPAPASPAE